ncbi:MAG: CBS domain-containing protein [Oscillospiraceae bacterium]|nr:CBS domain-containing protein [Oscillospiraceae bacterium]
MNVKDCMNRHVIAVAPDESVAVAARLMARHNVGALPVRDRDGVLCGIVTDRDMVLRCMALNRPAETTSVSRVMTNRVAAVPPDASLSHAAMCMAREQVRRLPVVEGRRLVGMVSLGDLSHRDDYAMEAAEALSEITANVKSL